MIIRMATFNNARSEEILILSEFRRTLGASGAIRAPSKECNLMNQSLKTIFEVLDEDFLLQAAITG